MERYTCYDDKGEKFPDAVEGTKEEVLAWMKARFGSVRRKNTDMLPAWAFFFQEGDAHPYSAGKGREVYLIEFKGNGPGNWAHLSGMDWSYLLQYQPRFADKCDWSKLGGRDWADLLFRQPQFADKCDWEKLDGGDWAELLSWQPQFADRCDWSKLDADNWYKLVGQRPEFADRCDMRKFTGSHIVRLFRERGRNPATGLSRRVGECDLSTLTASDWCRILAMRPDLADVFEESTRDWEADERAMAEADSVSDEEAAIDG